MTVTLGQVVTALAIVSALFAAGRAWEAHEQRLQQHEQEIRDLQRQQRYSHGDLTPFLKE